MTLNGFGHGSVAITHIPIDMIRRQKERLKREIQEIREKIAQCDVQMSMMQSSTRYIPTD